MGGWVDDACISSIYVHKTKHSKIVYRYLRTKCRKGVKIFFKTLT